MSQVRGRPFQPGNSYGRGRPKGSRNKITSEIRRILDEASVAVLVKCILQAKNGHFPSQRLVVDLLRRLQPTRTRRSRVKKIANFADLQLAAEQVVLDMLAGKTTSAEAQASMSTLEQMGRLLALRQEDQKSNRPPKQVFPEFMRSALEAAHAARLERRAKAGAEMEAPGTAPPPLRANVRPNAPPASPNGEMEAPSADPPPM